jgi:hypothetical protein
LELELDLVGERRQITRRMGAAGIASKRGTRRIVTGRMPAVAWERFDPVSTLKDRVPWLVIAGFCSLLVIQYLIR